MVDVFKLFFCLQVIAEEASPNSHLRHNATVTVFLKDVNEFNPEFNQTIYSASVKENEVIGIPLLTVSFIALTIKARYYWDNKNWYNQI